MVQGSDLLYNFAELVCEMNVNDGGQFEWVEKDNIILLCIGTLGKSHSFEFRFLNRSAGLEEPSRRTIRRNENSGFSSWSGYG
jgi:hypothetical protein